MLRCPKCKCIYHDETQKFCTSDGTRILRVGRGVGEIPETDLSRRTPYGELLFETFVSPPSSSSVKKVAPTKVKPSYQMFGLHSSNIAHTAPETKATNGFHSFDYLIVKENETKLTQAQLVPKLNETSGDNSNDGRESEKKRKFGGSFILLCLIGALIFLICLGFAVNYLLTEQKQLSPAAPSVIRETSRVIGAGVEKSAAVLSENASSFSLQKNIQTKERQT